MRLVSALVVAVVLLAAAGFCLFGFLATFEPANDPTRNLIFRIGYALLGIAATAGALRALVRGLSSK